MAGQPLPKIEQGATLESMVITLNAILELIDERLATSEQAVGRNKYIPSEGAPSTKLPDDLTTATAGEVAAVLNTLINDLKESGRLQ